MVAPTCPISYSQQTAAIRSLAAQINSIPHAHDLPSVITAINRINNVLNILTRGEPQVNNVYPATEAGVPQPDPPFNAANIAWEEASRVYNVDKLQNPDDDSQFIPIPVIQHLVFSEKETGVTITYDRFG